MIDDIKIALSRRAKKITLPSFVLTEICNESDEGAMKAYCGSATNPTVYYERPKTRYSTHRFEPSSQTNSSQFNLYPVVLTASGQPWSEANLYIHFRLENATQPSMTTYHGMADDLSAYLRFVDQEEIDWQNFPAQKLARPTYRYNSHLLRLIRNDELAASSAKRRMSTIIAFYKWLKSEGILEPLHPPWKESDIYLKLAGPFGLAFTKQIATTDISIRISKQDNPYDGKILDGSKLRPLTFCEQQWILKALFAQGNTEMTLIHLLAIFTGARIQAILTFRLRHVYKMFSEENTGNLEHVRCPIGMGTGIDNKNGKHMSIHIPQWLCCMLFTYAKSERACRRRALAKGGDFDEQYLFLSKYGTPFYSSKADNLKFDPDSKSRQQIKGQSIRKFMSEVIVPYIRENFDVTFHYQFHDLRATFGMNLTDAQLKLVEQKKRTLHQVREYVRVRMGHASAAITDRYLQFHN